MKPTQKSKVEDVALERLTPHPMNPRKGNVDAIAESIQTNGFYGVVVVQKSTNYILAGNHRWLAAQQLGLPTIPAMFVDCSDAQAKKILLADNRLNDIASYDDNELQALLRSVLAETDLKGTGFDVTDVQEMIDDVNDDPDEKRKRNLEPFHAVFFLIKAPITEQGRLSALISDAIKDIEGVEFASANN